MIKVGVIGTGNFGRKHIECLSRIPEFDLVGFFDINDEVASGIKSVFGLKQFNSAEDLMDAADAVDIVTPTSSHYEYAAIALKKFKHVFIEKPLVSNLSEARQLIDIAHEAGVMAQVGHIERFNPAYIAAMPYIKNPLFIEAIRHGVCTSRFKDTSVVLDLLIHDIDLVLKMVNANVRRIYANGVAMIGNRIDMANARIEFDNGSVANLTANRVSPNKLREIRVYQRQELIKMDLLKKRADIIKFGQGVQKSTGRLNQGLTATPVIKQGLLKVKHLKIELVDSLQAELKGFAIAIQNKVSTEVTLLDGYNSVEIADRISEKIEANGRRF
jgi:predicted dehydrogenase